LKPELAAVVGVALLSLSILGCGSDAPVGPTEGDAPTPVVTPVATAVTLSTTVLSFSSLGATEQLTATVQDQNEATMDGAPVSWASSAPSVASVSSSGLVTAVADGEATISATSGSAMATGSVTVDQVPESIQFDREWVAFDELDVTDMVLATVIDALKNPIEGAEVVAWTTSKAEVATVDASGRVTSVGAGTAQITASFEALSASIGVTVNIWDPLQPSVIGSFTSSRDDIAGYITTRAVADLNGDFNDDFVITGWTGCRPEGACGVRNPPVPVKLFIRGDDGRFVDKTLDLVGQEVEAWVNVPVIADLNGDGTPDIFLGGFTDLPAAEAPSKLLLSSGGGYSVVEAPHLFFWAHSAEAADLDGDGCMDIAISEATSPILMGDCTGNLFRSGYTHGTGRPLHYEKIPIEGADHVLSTPGLGAHTCFGDFNRDGSLDVVTVDSSTEIQDGDGWSLYAQDGVVLNVDWSSSARVREVYALPTPVRDRERPLGQLGSHDMRCAVADLDGDGYDDIFVSSAIGDVYWQGLEVADWDSQFQVYLNKGDWTFEDISDSAFPGRGPWEVPGFSILLEDFNADGVLDLFLSGGNISLTGGEGGEPNPIWLGNGDGTFRRGGLPDLVAMAYTGRDRVVEFADIPDNVVDGVIIGEIAPLRRATGEIDFLVPVTSRAGYSSAVPSGVPTIFLVFIPAGVHS